ncbi:MAG: acyl-CoA dehydrogenase family protein, partial [Pseudomonadota bacterium]
PQLGEMGYLGITVEGTYGGSDLDYLTAGLIYEAMAEANPSIAFSAFAHGNLCLDNIHRNATDEQRQYYVPKLCSGEWVGGLAMTEPEAGSDAVGSMRTRAELDGDEFVINGSKIYITNGSIADVLLVYAKTNMEAGSKGITAFIVETDNPGFVVSSKLSKMGWRGSPLAELRFDNCRVPVSSVLGEPDHGVRVMMSGLDIERAMAAPLSLGTAERALELSIEHAKTRRQFKRPIAEFQLIQAKLAEMYMRLEAARALSYQALSMCDSLDDLSDAGRGPIHKISAAALHEAARASSFVMDEGAQIHGGSAYMSDTEINRLYRTAKVMEIAAGTQEIRKLIVAEELLS